MFNVKLRSRTLLFSLLIVASSFFSYFVGIRNHPDDIPLTVAPINATDTSQEVIKSPTLPPKHPVETPEKPIITTQTGNIEENRPSKMDTVIVWFDFHNSRNVNESDIKGRICQLLKKTEPTRIIIKDSGNNKNYNVKVDYYANKTIIILKNTGAEICKIGLKDNEASLFKWNEAIKNYIRVDGASNIEHLNLKLSVQELLN